MKKSYLLMNLVFFILISGSTLFAQTYRPVELWSDSVNERLENFLNSTLIIKERKVAVFDMDGTLFGQVPHYLADEALYAYAKENYEGKQDRKSKEKMKIINKLAAGDNVGQDYVRNRIKFLSGMTPKEVEDMGENMFHEKYEGKFYPQMRTLLANLEEYDFEIWVISASPELLYQGFVHKALGISKDRILGVRSVVRDGVVTDELVNPVPQDAGKAEVIQTFIKAKPLFAGGNARGDMEMMNESVGLKIMVNADDEKKEKDMGGMTAKEYWEKDENAINVRCEDITEGEFRWITKELGLPENKSNPVD